MTCGGGCMGTGVRIVTDQYRRAWWVGILAGYYLTLFGVI